MKMEDIIENMDKDEFRKLLDSCIRARGMEFGFRSCLETDQRKYCHLGTKIPLYCWYMNKNYQARLRDGRIGYRCKYGEKE